MHVSTLIYSIWWLFNCAPHLHIWLLTCPWWILTCRWWRAPRKLFWRGRSMCSSARCCQSDPWGIKPQRSGMWNLPGPVPPTQTTPETCVPQQQWLQRLEENTLWLVKHELFVWCLNTDRSLFFVFFVNNQTKKKKKMSTWTFTRSSFNTNIKKMNKTISDGMEVVRLAHFEARDMALA